jgi:hypothetical protein
MFHSIHEQSAHGPADVGRDQRRSARKEPFVGDRESRLGASSGNSRLVRLNSGIDPQAENRVILRR